MSRVSTIRSVPTVNGVVFSVCGQSANRVRLEIFGNQNAFIFVSQDNKMATNSGLPTFPTGPQIILERDLHGAIVQEALYGITTNTGFIGVIETTEFA